MIEPVTSLKSVAPYALADLGGTERPTLAQNESAFPPSPLALAAGHAALARAALYPDPDWRELRQAIAETYGLKQGAILCGAGSMDLISCLIRAFAGTGDEVVGTRYGYLFVAAATAQADAAYVTAAETDFTVSVDHILATVGPATRIVFLCNPGNPTGTRIANAEIVRLRAALRADVLLVVDQAYGEFDDQDPHRVFALVERGDTVVLRTLSKAYGLAGLRVGWGLFPPRIADEVRKLQNSNTVSVVGLAMATAAIRDGAYARQVVAETAAIRDWFAERLRAGGLEVVPSHTNFVLVRFADAAAAQAADGALRRQGLIARSVAGYGLADCLRVTIGPRATMAAALAALSGT